MESDEIAYRLGRALSVALDPAQAAAWVEGFLSGSGQLLLHDERLWAVLDNWVSGLSADVFLQLLPLLRRTFGTFPAPERRRMGERVRDTVPGTVIEKPETSSVAFDAERAAKVIPTVAKLLGLKTEAA